MWDWRLEFESISTDYRLLTEQLHDGRELMMGSLSYLVVGEWLKSEMVASFPMHLLFVKVQSPGLCKRALGTQSDMTVPFTNPVP